MYFSSYFISPTTLLIYYLFIFQVCEIKHGYKSQIFEKNTLLGEVLTNQFPLISVLKLYSTMFPMPILLPVPTDTL